MRYGRLRGAVLGMKVVLPDGTILDDMTMMRKDNTGYDVKQLFIGSEGTLGVITEISLLLPALPKSVNLVLFGCNSFENVKKLCSTAKRNLGEIVSACEFMDETAMRSVVKNVDIPYPLEKFYKYYFLVETSGMNEVHDREKLESFVDASFEKGLCSDGVIPENRNQVATVFSLREMIAVGLRPLGHNYQFDLSVPIHQMEEVLKTVKAQFAKTEEVTVVGYGHIGDNDIHIHVITPQANESVESRIEPFIYELVNDLGGSISSEHGIGYQKAKMLPLNKNSAILETMRVLKNTFDPNGILNPYKLLE